MANILIGYNNRALDATMTSNGSWDSTLVLNNIKSERLALVARTASASRNNTTFVAKFAANYALRAIALLNHNVSTAGRWRARLSTATLDLDYTGTNPRNPGNVTFSGGANGTYVDYLGTVTSGSCPRVDFSPVNLASGAATQTVSSVPAGRYVLSCSGSGSVTATGSTVDNSGTVGMQSVVTFVDVTATGDVTLTVAGTVTAINFRESLGLLVEEARTNSVLYSAAFDNAAWTLLLGASVTGNFSTAPDGTMSADKLTVASGQYIFQSAAGTGTCTFSCYVKVASGTNQFRMAAFNATDGTQQSAILTATTQWQRFSLTVDVTAASSWYPCNVDLLSGGEFLLWGAQLEAGSFPTTYIPTTSAAVTRTADNVSITGSNFTSWFSAAAGTFYAEADATLSSLDGFVLQADDGSTNNRFALFRRGANAYGALYVESGGATQAFMPTVGDWGTAPPRRIAGAYAVNDVAASVNGGAVVSDTSVTLPVSPTTLRIGSVPGGGYLNGHIRRITYWPTRRTNAELQTITTSGPDALGLDTGWQDALAMTFHGDTPTNWGAQYPLIAATSEAVTARYLTVEIDDTTNAAGYVQIGHLYASGGFQPEHNAERPGFADGRIDLSSSVKSVGGQKYSTARRRPRTVDFNFPVLEQDEGDHLDEMMAEVGTTEDVLYVPDPADPAKTQRYGFLGTLRELTPLEYPFFDHRAMPLRLEQKL